MSKKSILISFKKVVDLELTPRSIIQKDRKPRLGGNADDDKGGLRKV